MNIIRIKKLATALAVAFALPVAYAQQTAGTPEASAESPEAGLDDQDVVVLSPFQIDASQDSGYQANNTLAGTRIRTELGDVATAIQVVTKELLDDTGSQNLREILVYTTNTEVNGTGGNFTDFSEASTGFGGHFLEPLSTTTRIRGLAGADTTRDFFRTIAEFDSYNSERVEINRGANAALFGLGSPAGIINYTLITPNLAKSGGSVTGLVDNYGTVRANFDYNQMLLEDELAVRVAGLYEDQKYRQDFKYSESKRAFITAQYDPAFLKDKGILTGVSLRASYEGGDGDSNLPRSVVPQENITTWLALNKPTWDPRNDSLSGADRQVYGHASTFNLVTVYPDPNTTEVANSYVGIVQPSRPPAQDDPSRTIFAIMAVPWANSFVVSDLNPFWRRLAISDPNVFNFYEETLEGPNKSEFSDFDAVNAAIDAQFFENRLGFEIAYDQQSLNTGNTDTGISQGLNMLHVDINTHLYTGEVNPNYGRAFFSASSIGRYSEVDLETFRVTGFYRFDFEDVTDSSWAEWAGSIDFTALYTDQSRDSMGLSGFTYTYDDRYGLYQGNGRNRVDNVSWDRPHQSWYISDSLLGISDTSEARLHGVTAVRRPDISNAQFTVWDPAAEQWTTAAIGVERQEPGPDMPWARTARLDRQEIESKVLVVQPRIIKDLVIGTLSWREDTSKSFANGSPPRGSRREVLYRDSSFVLPDDPGLEASARTFSYGVVARAPGFIVDKIPGLSDFSIFYNESENFEPANLTQDPFGNPLGAPTGETTDYGFRMALMENRINFGFTWYETNQTGVNAGLGGVAGAVARLESRVLTRLRENDNALDVSQLDQNATTPGLTQAQLDAQIADWLSNPWSHADRWLVDLDDRVDFVTPPGTTDTYDLTSKGIEIESVMNLTPSWRLTFNLVKQESSQANTGTSVLEFVNERIDLYRRAPDLPTTESFAENVRLSLNNDILARYYQVAAKDGNTRPEVRKWRFNIVTNYIFQEGVLDGFNVGGAWRWQDKSATGYATYFDDELGIFRIDTDSPYYGPREGNIDFWVGYVTPIFSDRVSWKTQLNIRNVLGDDDLVPFYTNPDGRHSGFRIPAERTFELRTTFEF